MVSDHRNIFILLQVCRRTNINHKLVTLMDVGSLCLLVVRLVYLSDVKDRRFLAVLSLSLSIYLLYPDKSSLLTAIPYV